MANLKELCGRIKSVASIAQITRAMEMVASMKLRKVQAKAQAFHPYTEEIRHMIERLAGKVSKEGDLPLFQAREVKTVGFFVVSSDRGLCGSYNEILAEKVARHCQDQTGPQTGPPPRLLCIGAQMNDALRDQGLAPEAVLLPPASAEGIGRLAGDIVTRLARLGHGQALHRLGVTLAFTRRGEHGLREPVTRRLLPLQPSLLQRERRWHSRSLPDYSMSADALLASLIRSHIFASVFRASAEAMVTEIAARLALMQQAEQSVDERLEEVQAEMRSVRQTEITNELMDVIIGHLE